MGDQQNVELQAEINGIKYTPFLCKFLKEFGIEELAIALKKQGSFLLIINKSNRVAVSWWVSAKRTRSYPYGRVYDTLNFGGKKITIISIFKDEGKEGDRDFLQWDTVSLMSLLGVYVIIAYYRDAEKSKRYRHKITNQNFDIDYIKMQIKGIISYQSDALHWNLAQVEKAGEIAQKALQNYEKISKKLDVEMHSRASAEKRIRELLRGKNEFMNLSRQLAHSAQLREQRTVQPKENLAGKKALITIKNYLGGYYYFTVDEYEIQKDKIYLIEGKHSKKSLFPSLADIKDGLFKMILFTNLENVRWGNKILKPITVLKLTTAKKFNENNLSPAQKTTLSKLRVEAKHNDFMLRI